MVREGGVPSTGTEYYVPVALGSTHFRGLPSLTDRLLTTGGKIKYIWGKPVVDRSSLNMYM